MTTYARLKIALDTIRDNADDYSDYDLLSTIADGIDDAADDLAADQPHATISIATWKRAAQTVRDIAHAMPDEAET